MPLLTYICACRCPYYGAAYSGLYGNLNITDVYATSYWADLPSVITANTASTACNFTTAWLPHRFKAAYFADPNNPTCGEYLQLASLYPGSGPATRSWCQPCST